MRSAPRRTLVIDMGYRKTYEMTAAPGSKTNCRLPYIGRDPAPSFSLCNVPLSLPVPLAAWFRPVKGRQQFILEPGVGSLV